MPKYVCMDLGLKRIGLAYSPDGKLVTPLPAVIRKNRNQASLEVDQALKEWEADIFVIGLPMSDPETQAEMRRRISHFLSLLSFKGEVYYQDEDDSSLEAEEMMKGDIRYKRDGRIDSLAAKIILERYLI
jgi:putative holliday junction resolvase